MRMSFAAAVKNESVKVKNRMTLPNVFARRSERDAPTFPCLALFSEDDRNWLARQLKACKKQDKVLRAGKSDTPKRRF